MRLQRTLSSVLLSPRCARGSRTRAIRTAYCRPDATAFGRSICARHERGDVMSDARDIIEQLLRRSRGPRGPNGPRTITPGPPNISWKAVIAGIVALIVLWTAASSLYQVQPDELGVITRFGRVIGIAENGLNFKLPFGIDAVQVVPTQRVQKEEFGFRSEK